MLLVPPVLLLQGQVNLSAVRKALFGLVGRGESRFILAKLNVFSPFSRCRK